MKGLSFAAAFLCVTAAQGMDYVAVFDKPPVKTPTAYMPDGPLLGNGDVGVVLGGPPEAQIFYIGKNDLWDRGHVAPVGRVTLNIPALTGATYHQEQDLAHAEVRGTFTKDGLTVRTRSRVDANCNLLLTDVQCEGAQPVPVKVQVFSGELLEMPAHVIDNGQPARIGREMHGGGRWDFKGRIADVTITDKVLDGTVPPPPKDQDQAAVNNGREMEVPKMDKSVSVGAWVKIEAEDSEANYIVTKGDWNEAYSLGLSAGRLRWAINGTSVQTEQPLETGKWLYVEGTYDGKRMCVYVDGTLKASYGSGGFVRKTSVVPTPERIVAVETRVIGAEGGLDFVLKPGATVTIATGLMSNLDVKDPVAATRDLVWKLTPQKLMEMEARHRAWWADFWSRSYIEIPDKEIEKHWYGALYAMGSCCRPGKTAPGLWANWITTPGPAWNGDFHLNYNFEAPFYILFSSNHSDLSLPYCQALTDWLPKAKTHAAQRGQKGAFFPVAIGPWGTDSPDSGNDFGQRSDGIYAAMDFISYWRYQRDDAFLRDACYPFLSEIAAYWEDWLKLDNGRYIIQSDAVQEGTGPNLNPIVSLGMVRTLFSNMIPMSEELGVDADKRAKWQDILDRLSAFPTQQKDGKTVFRYTEAGPDWWRDNAIGIQHIFPGGAINLNSDPKLLEISRNMIEAMHRWHDPNGFSSFYTAAARVGYDPDTILENLHAECLSNGMPNLVLAYNGGGLENVSGFLAVNEMLLQSCDGILRFFPDWPNDKDAKFGSLRAEGAFLVFAEMKAGKIGGVKILSEKGRDCTVVNPWPGRKVGIALNGAPAATMEGVKFTFKTKPGGTYQLRAL